MTTEELLQFDREHVWHPYTSALKPITSYAVESASANKLTLKDGRVLIDGMSSWWAVAHGYNNPRINQAIRNQLEKMSHVMFGGITHEPAVRLAQKLISLLDSTLPHVFFCDSGSVAVEVAMKMALQYWNSLGKNTKSKFATIRSGYHGDTWNAMSVCDPVTGMHSIFSGALRPQIFTHSPNVAFDGTWDESDLDEMRKVLESQNDEIAAVILEPIVQGAGAMKFYHPNFLKGVRKLCDEFKVLLIADEIATGFGRTGKMFACNHANITPDIMCLGKAITGGYLSFAAVCASRDVAYTISEGEAGVFMHGPTFMANPLACAAANAAIDIVSEEGYLQNVLRIERVLKENLECARSLPQVADVRTLGAIGVIETKENIDVQSIQRKFVERGVWIRPFGKLAYLMPPFISPSEDVKTLCEVLVKSISEL